MLSVCERSFYAEEMLCLLKDSVSHVWGSFAGPMTPGQLALYKQLALFTLLSIKARFTLALITSVSVYTRCSIFTGTVNTLVDIWKQEIKPNESDSRCRLPCEINSTRSRNVVHLNQLFINPFSPSFYFVIFNPRVSNIASSRNTVRYHVVSFWHWLLWHSSTPIG